MQADQDTIIDSAKLGPNIDGTYITPYQVTIFYHPTSLFESAVAAVSAQAQSIPLSAEINPARAIELCEHPSPEALIFGTEFSREEIMLLLNRGFKIVHIFGDDDDGKYDEAGDDLLRGRTHKIFDERVVTFSANEIYDHLVLDGFATLYVLEHILHHTFAQYVGVVDDVDSAAGKYFIYRLNMLAQVRALSPQQILRRLCSSIKGIEETKLMVVEGRALFEHRESVANEQLEGGISFYIDHAPGVADNSAIEPIKKHLVRAIYDCGFQTELLNLIPVHPAIMKSGTEYVLLYRAEHHSVEDTTFPGWRVTLIVANSGASSALELLHNYAPLVTAGTPGHATCWVGSKDAHALLPFLFLGQ